MLTEREFNAAIGACAREYNSVLKSKAKHWRPSTKALTLAELYRTIEKLKVMKNEAGSEREEASGTSDSV